MSRFIQLAVRSRKLPHKSFSFDTQTHLFAAVDVLAATDPLASFRYYVNGVEMIVDFDASMTRFLRPMFEVAS